MPFAEEANRLCCPHRLPGPAGETLFTEHCSPFSELGPSFQLLGVMNQIMAEHFGLSQKDSTQCRSSGFESLQSTGSCRYE